MLFWLKHLVIDYQSFQKFSEIVYLGPHDQFLGMIIDIKHLLSTCHCIVYRLFNTLISSTIDNKVDVVYENLKVNERRCYKIPSSGSQLF